MTFPTRDPETMKQLQQSVLRTYSSKPSDDRSSMPDEPIEIKPRSTDVHPYGLKTLERPVHPSPNVMPADVRCRQCERCTTEMKTDSEAAETVAVLRPSCLACRRQACRFDTQLCASGTDQDGERDWPHLRQAGVCRWFGTSAESDVRSVRQSEASVCAMDWFVPDAFEATLRRPDRRLSRVVLQQPLPWPDSSLDAVITDPPYYDNVSLRRHFRFLLRLAEANRRPPLPGTLRRQRHSEEKRSRCRCYRHGGTRRKQSVLTKTMMAEVFSRGLPRAETRRPMAVVYAHKTTLGWATLVDALRNAGFVVTEAWPLDTEMTGRLRAMDSAALASSIFLVARKREGAKTGNLRGASSHPSWKQSSASGWRRFGTWASPGRIW